MVKGQDIVVLLKIGQEGDWSFPMLSDALGLSVSALHRSLHRAGAAGLYDPKRKIVRGANLREFLVHATKYVFPPHRTGETRGIPTAWASPLLASHFAPSDALPFVWPYAFGAVRGMGLEPLHPLVPEAATKDGGLGERLAVVDALRLGDARLAEVAIRELDHLLSIG